MCSKCGWDQDHEFEDKDSGLPPAFEDLAEQEEFIDKSHRLESEDEDGN
jgi:hypothetical protein